MTEQKKVDSPPAIANLFEQQAAAHPDRIAVKSKKHQLTFDELNRSANRLAHAIVNRLGIAAEPTVLLLDKDVFVIVAIVAVLKAHKFYVLPDMQSPESRLGAIIQDVQPRLILTDTTNQSLAIKLAGDPNLILNLDPPSTESDENLGLTLSSNDLFAIFYTSGSTGTPKGVVDFQARHLRAWQRRDNESQHDTERIGLLGSPGFAGYRSSVINALINGNGLYLYDLGTDGLGNLADWLEQEQITSLTFMASVFRHFAMTLASHPPLAVPHLQSIGLGGERALRRDVELFRQYFPDTCQLRLSYASTEAGMISAYTIDKQTEITSDVLPVGNIVPGKQVMILGESGNPIKPGQVGEIVVKSRHMNTHYWRRPDLTHSTFLSDPAGGDEQIYHTGDLGRIRPDGMLELVGRKDEQIKIRGNRVETGEVEMALFEFPGIRDACVVARENSNAELELVAYLMADSHPSPSELRDTLSRKLPEYSIPLRYVFLDSLPLLPNGKVNRRALPAPDTRRRNAVDDFIAPNSQLELELVAIWEELLNVRPISVADKFFELGGHSLLAARMLTEIEKKYGRKFPPRVLLEASTIQELAALLSEEGWQPDWSALVPIRKEGARPPLFYIPPVNAVIGFYQLALYLPPDQPLYALLASPSGQELPFTRLDEEAAFYVSQIKTVQPHGPYYLLGWSYGGITAFEMAQQLFRQGEHVAFLGVLDVSVSMEDLGSRLDYWVCRAKYISGLGARGIFSRLLSRTGQSFKDKLGNLAKGELSQGREQLYARPDYPEIKDRVGFRGYVPKKYPGRVTLFQVDDDAPGLCRNHIKNWARIAAQGVQAHHVPGTHNAMLLEPYVRDLAEKLCASLREAQNEPDHHSS